MIIMKNQKEQIEQMKNDICEIINDTMYHLLDEDDSKYLAEMLYDEGYRKQSEGEWEKLDREHFNCTHCGQIFALGSTVTIYDVKRVWKFCPNCGAKMKGGE